MRNSSLRSRKKELNLNAATIGSIVAVGCSAIFIGGVLLCARFADLAQTKEVADTWVTAMGACTGLALVTAALGVILAHIGSD